MKLVYGITVADEEFEVLRLLELLKNNTDDIIVVQMDLNKYNEDLFKKINNYTHRVYAYPFDNDFSKFKNELNKNCRLYGADFIFQLDADEMIPEFLIKNVNNHLKLYGSFTDAFAVPRINIVNGLTQEHLDKWGWIQTNDGRINYPDFQTRLFRSNLIWTGKVHERITGKLRMGSFPLQDDYSILHIKNIDKQEKQNSFYDNFRYSNI